MRFRAEWGRGCMEVFYECLVYGTLKNKIIIQEIIFCLVPNRLTSKVNVCKIKSEKRVEDRSMISRLREKFVKNEYDIYKQNPDTIAWVV
jgi:hypothetical protein